MELGSHVSTYSGVSPEGAPGTFLARGSWRTRMLAKMVIAIDRNSTEVAHLGTTAARHAVAAFGFDEACSTLVAFSNASSSHFFFTEKRKKQLELAGKVNEK